jgi:hypothetical protein
MGTDAVVMMPWRETPDRLDAFRLAVRSWEEQGFTVVPVDSGHEPFNRAASRNLAVRTAEDRDLSVVVIADADTFGEPDPVREAVAWARTSGSIHLPYTTYRSLGQNGMADLEWGTHPQDCWYIEIAVACSGIFITTPETWWSVGGMDERFSVWAPEDWALRVAHETLIGPYVRHTGNAYALYHLDPPNKFQGPEYEAAVDLYARYMAASGNKAEMLTLIGASDAGI